MVGYLATTWSCPRCGESMSASHGKPDFRHCSQCVESFQLQFGYLVVAGSGSGGIDLVADSAPSPAIRRRAVDIDLTGKIELDLDVATEPVS